MTTSKASQPWFKFYTSDWRADPSLRSVSYAARGLWMDMLSLMHEAEPYGHLLIKGRAPKPKQIAAILGGTEKQVAALLSELESEGVLSRTDAGVIYSRRMERDYEKAQRDRENGKGGGNPALKPSLKVVGGNSGPEGVNPPHNAEDNEADKAGDKARARAHQIPEARGQKEEREPASQVCPTRRSLFAYEADFEEWWAAYPSRPNDNKRDAAKAYANAVKSVSAGFLLEQVRAYRFPSDPQFIRHAATWLNKRSWEDRAVSAPQPQSRVSWMRDWIDDETGDVRDPMRLQ